MEKVELLSPVGNMESLYQAIHNGADAVYLGGKRFGARNFANNFNHEQLQKAIYECHLYGVKIYITMNTVIFDNEIDEFLEEVKFLYENGVDALIIQDIGMIKLVRDNFPSLEIHASTQVHNYNQAGIKLLEQLGVKRVVLARELGLDEINKLDINIEKEIFIHGALCVSFSGCCLFSRLNGGRSGNRGECVGSCRLPYKLLCNDEEIKTNGNYLLSTKELNTVSNLEDILKSDIKSLKIEGRMKSPEYVGFVTKLYRTLIDKFYENKELEINGEEIDQLKILFNRDFTKGFISGEHKNNIMNINSPNHIGLNLGEVIYCDKKIIKIKLNKYLHQEDGIRFLNSGKGMIVNRLYNEKGLLVNSLSEGEIAVIDNKIDLVSNDIVNKTLDYLLINKLKDLSKKKIKVDIQVLSYISKELKVVVKDENNNIVEVIGDVVEESKNSPTSRNQIEKQLSKLGNTPFVINEIEIVGDQNIFIPVSKLNDIRRTFTEGLIIKRTSVNVDPVKLKIDVINKDTIKKQFMITALIRNEEQLLICLKEDIDRIYTDDYSLFNKYSNKGNIYFKTDRITNNYKNHPEGVLATELGAINYYKNNDIVGDYSLNITNKKSVLLLDGLGVKTVTLSPEVNLNTINYSNLKTNIEVVIYGRLELMVMKYCPLNLLINKKDKKCNVCRDGNEYFLKDINNSLYPILNKRDITYILANRRLNDIDNIRRYKKLGINCFRIEFYEENINEVSDLIKRVKGEVYE